MLSNSNVFILLILIKHSALFETTSANLVALNARVDAHAATAAIDDTKSNTVETVTTPLSHVDHHPFIGDSTKRGGGGGTQPATIAHSRPLADNEIKATATTTKGPLVAGSSKQAASSTTTTTDREDNGAATADDENVDGDDDLMISIHRAQTIAIPTQSTIDREIKLTEQIPSSQRQQQQSRQRQTQQSTDNLKSAQNVSSKLEIVSSTLANAVAKKTNHNFQTKPTTPPPSISNQHSNHDLNLGETLSQNHSAYVENSWLSSKSANNNGNSNNQVIEDNGSIKKSVDYVNGRNDDDDNNDDVVNPDIQLQPQSDAPSQPHSATMDSSSSSSSTTDPQLDLMKPRSDAVYFIVAVIGGAKIWARTLARTLHEMGPPFSGDPLGSPLRPIYVDLPTNGRFSVNVLLSMCQQSEKRPLAGVVVIGNGQSAHAVAYAGSAMQLPVLWAKGGSTYLRELHPEATLQAVLQPSAIEIFEAVRSLFLQTHWHSFFVLSDVQATSVMNVKDNPLKRAPLVPTIVPLPRNSGDVFKQLAQISRSTRGVILLLSNVQATKSIMTEAHRLNMVGGHFIWMWIDTSSSTGYFHQASAPVRHSSKSEQQQQQRQSTRKSNNSDDGAKMTDESQKSTNTMSTVSSSTSKPSATGSQKIATRPESGSTGKNALDKNGAQMSVENGDQSTKVDFSQGFDPFRVLQRQDEHTQQHYQERTVQRDNKQTPANRLILGLRSENTHTDSDDEHARSKKTRRSSSSSSKKGKTGNAATESSNSTQTQNRTSNRHKNTGKIIQSSNSSSSSKSSVTPAERMANNSNKNNNKNNSNADNDDDGDGDGDDVDGGDKMPNFISNQTSTAKNSIHSKYRNFSDDNLDDFIDNNSFNEIYNNNLKLNNNKRTSTANGSISSSFVNFHQFKDFPVGLLALRPIRMNVDRHFIRAAVRLFAATWEQINGSQATGNQAKKHHRSAASVSSPLSSSAAAAAAAAASASASSQSRRTQPNRSAHTSMTLYNAKKFGNEMHGRQSRRKRNIFTINQLLTVAMENRSTKMSDTVVALKQVNSSVLLKDISGNSDNDNDNGNDNLNINVRQINNTTDANKLGIRHISSSSSSSNSVNSRSVDNNINNTNEYDTGQFMQFNRSSTSDLSNSRDSKYSTKYSANDGVSLANVNVSFNRKFSGLWKQNSKNKSNISSLNSQRYETMQAIEAVTAVASTTEAAPLSAMVSSSANVFVPFASLSNVTNQRAISFNRHDLSAESIARQASQTVVRNFLDFGDHLQDIRRPSNKRQNAWWSSKRESTAATTSTESAATAALVQSKRPQHDTNQLAHAQHIIDPDPTDNNDLKCTTPSYSGGCYGTATAHDVKNADCFSRALKEATKLALSGRAIYNGISETALTTNFELLNLVPGDHPYYSKMNGNQAYSSKSTTTGDNPPHHKVKRSPTPTHTPATATTSTNSNANAKNVTSTSATKWRHVGLVSASSVRLDTIVWPGGDIVVSGLSAGARHVFRIVTALAPPFVMESELDEDGLCLRGLPCHRVSPVGRHNLTLMFNAIETRDRLEEDAVEHGNDLPPEPEHIDEKISHETKCCYGLTMDLLDNIATELSFEFHLYVVRDQLFGSKQQRDIKDFLKASGTRTKRHANNANGNGADDGNTSSQQTAADHDINDEMENTEQWNGIIGDLVSGSADMSFAPLSVSKARAEVIDFSIPYFHSGVSLLASPKTKSEIPLLAFLLPFSPELWIAIFTSLNITAVAVAVYEWLSPFGLNPWGRQRSKNFSLSSALWVMWGLLCGHLVAFKAPKSWPNKFLINVWGGFSVIFVASYTANIAALIAGLFFHHAASSYDSSLETQRVGAPIASAAESYVQNKDKHLWEHMKKYSLNHIEDGIRGLKNDTLDLLMADSPILDYYRATDHGCNLQRITSTTLGDTYVEDTYAIGMVKGFPLKESISALIAKYSTNGYLDILTEKWYGGLPCFKYEAEIVTPRPLGVAAVAGVFLLLGLGMVMGVVILIFEHWFYKYALPSLRLKPKGTIWKSRNIMFFSQKLYRFINCVELVSPHHAARELVHSIRQGQIASLFQKSIKRKEDEQRRRRKSKAQFFEMIQEIRRAQQVERQNLAAVTESDTQKDNVKSPPNLFKPRASPKPGIFSALKKDGRSRSNSSVLTPRRFSTDSILGDRMDSIGRRLSRDLTNSPPDMNKRLEFGKNDVSPKKYDTISGANLSALGISKSNESLTTRYDTFSGKTADKSVGISAVKLKRPGKRPKISFESYDGIEKEDGEYELPPVKEGLEPPQQNRTAAILRHKLHTELRSKHPPVGKVSMVDTTPNSIERPPKPMKSNMKHQRQKSLDNLDVQTDASNKLKTSPYRSDSAAGSLTKVNQRSQISLERLSREDLLRLSATSQSEIHEYLKGSPMPDRASEPP